MTSHLRSRAVPSPRCPRYRALDFWRGIAVLFVVVFHSTYYAASPALEDAVRRGQGSFFELLIAASTRLWVGVPMFFVISGYCIAAAADATRVKARSTGDYLLRRFRRIYPPYWIYLAIGAVGIGVLEYLDPTILTDPYHRRSAIDVLGMSALHVFGNVTLSETWLPRLVGEGQRFWLGHAWTLCYEEQFYWVLGMGLLLARRQLFWVTSIVTVVVTVLAVGGWGPVFKGLFLDGFWLDFAAGVLVYQTVNYGTRRHAGAVLGVLATGLAWQLATVGLITFRTAAFAFASLLILLHPIDGRMAAALPVRLVSRCGTMCYSVYLVHFPLVRVLSHVLWDAGVQWPILTVVVTIPMCVAAAIGLGWAFHLLVERRYLNAPLLAEVETPDAMWNLGLEPSVAPRAAR